MELLRGRFSSTCSAVQFKSLQYHHLILEYLLENFWVSNQRKEIHWFKLKPAHTIDLLINDHYFTAVYMEARHFIKGGARKVWEFQREGGLRKEPVSKVLKQKRFNFHSAPSLPKFVCHWEVLHSHTWSDRQTNQGRIALIGQKSAGSVLKSKLTHTEASAVINMKHIFSQCIACTVSWWTAVAFLTN